MWYCFYMQCVIVCLVTLQYYLELDKPFPHFWLNSKMIRFNHFYLKLFPFMSQKGPLSLKVHMKIKLIFPTFFSNLLCCCKIQICTNYYLNSLSFSIALTRKGAILFVIREVTPIKKQYNLRMKSWMCKRFIRLLSYTYK